MADDTTVLENPSVEAPMQNAPNELTASLDNLPNVKKLTDQVEAGKQDGAEPAMQASQFYGAQRAGIESPTPGRLAGPSQSHMDYLVPGSTDADTSGFHKPDLPNPRSHDAEPTAVSLQPGSSDKRTGWLGRFGRIGLALGALGLGAKATHDVIARDIVEPTYAHGSFNREDLGPGTGTLITASEPAVASGGEPQAVAENETKGPETRSAVVRQRDTLWDLAGKIYPNMQRGEAMARLANENPGVWQKDNEGFYTRANAVSTEAEDTEQQRLKAFDMNQHGPFKLFPGQEYTYTVEPSQPAKED